MAASVLGNSTGGIFGSRKISGVSVVSMASGVTMEFLTFLNFSCTLPNMIGSCPARSILAWLNSRWLLMRSYSRNTSRVTSELSASIIWARLMRLRTSS